ncbi:MAG: 23S rRNA (pseudouridine(1915)-N(3))-methyltransferase RlmH [Candidatus Fermentithermobacillus carboniphilus]|uniref:Ribosomal RNA large subunit methyltransferase H n=1 Tax=Candidatus Fermentithermobacillus carboniphilus TaxID=3085328 RepID=A0AAT9LB45_9FIRM|nr:MAG: 23S rRNA (pseudouridine(1915)-N(3))-methyltransferase RlmH [Candidatus Fermentithermobacillus carboniphilus]
MLHIRIILVGRIREQYLRDGVEEYLKRLKPYARVELLELQDEPVPESLSQKQLEAARAIEAERVLRTVREGEYLVAMDIRGKGMTSPEFSRWIQDRGLTGESNLAFVIGGTTGLAPEVLSRARLRLSMGPMTFPHQFMPLLLLEQIYRAFKIAAGEKYHR